MDAGGGVLGGDSIPGDAAGVGYLVGQLQNTAAQVQSIQSLITGQGLHGSWSGQAANAFQSTLGQLPGELDELSASFGGAAGALNAFRGALEGAQSQAQSLASQIEQAEAERVGAETRHRTAQRDLRLAESAHAKAADPVSQASAQREVFRARTEQASAYTAFEESGNQVQRLRERAHSNREDYESAARVCCNALDAASASGIQNSVLGGIGHFVGDVAHDVAAPFVWVGGRVEEAEQGVVGWVDQNWEAIHNVLEKLGTVLEVVGLIATVVAVFVAPELFVPILFAATRAQAVVDGVETGGDALVAATGNASEKRQADSNLVDDGFSLAGDFIGLKALKSGVKGEVSLFRQRIEDANYFKSGIAADRVQQALEPEKWQWKSAISRYQRSLVHVQVARYKEIISAEVGALAPKLGAHAAHVTIKASSQPLQDSGTSHRIGLPTAQMA